MTMHDFTWQAVLSPGDDGQLLQAEFPSFVPDVEFSLTNAWWMGQFCWIYYISDPQRRQSLLAKHGWKELAYWNNQVDVCGLIQGHGAHVLVFRGTQGWRPWITNLFYGKRRPKGPLVGRVHGGFQWGLMGLWQDIQLRLNTLSGPLFYTGHSRGGAMAILAAGFHPATAVYGLGAPFVADRTLAKDWQHPCYNIINYRDFVARVLLPNGWRYAWVGDSYWLTPEGLCMNPSRDTWANNMPKKDQGLRWSRQLVSFTTPPGPLSDHAPANYAANLERMIAGQTLAFHRL